MGDLSLQHKAARSLILRLREGMEQLEKLEQVDRQLRNTGDQERLSKLSKDLQTKLGELKRISMELDSIYRMQSLGSNATKMNLWKRKIEQVTEEEYYLRQAVERHTVRQHRRHVEDAERQELLQRDVEGRPWHARLDEDERAQSHVQNSKRLVEEMLQNGATILVDMSGQRERLKSAHRKMLDTLNSVGLSDSLLRVIERRQLLDKLIVYGGMMFVVFVILLIMWWRK